jgi:hypothetical protein
VDDGVNRGVGADAERERENGDQRETGAHQQRAQRRPNIKHSRIITAR